MNPLANPTTAARRLTMPLLAVVALASVGALALRSGAGFSRTAPNAAPIVAIVNVEKVVNDCAETDTRMKANVALKEKELKDLTKLQDQLADVKKDMKLLDPSNRAERQALFYKGMQIQGAGKVQEDILNSTWDQRNTDVIRDVYGKVVAAISAYAAQNHIDLVLIDDSSLPVPEDGSFNAVNAAIVQRRILFANKAQLDITNDILTILNNDYATTGGGKPAGSATPKKK